MVTFVKLTSGASNTFACFYFFIRLQKASEETAEMPLKQPDVPSVAFFSLTSPSHTHSCSHPDALFSLWEMLRLRPKMAWIRLEVKTSAKSLMQTTCSPFNPASLSAVSLFIWTSQLQKKKVTASILHKCQNFVQEPFSKHAAAQQ